MFLYPDNFANNTLYKERYYDSLDMKLDTDFEEEDIITKFLFKDFIFSEMNISIKNIIKIIENYPNVVEDFIIKLELLLNEFDSLYIHDYYNYIEPCNSVNWNIGYYRYKKIMRS